MSTNKNDFLERFDSLTLELQKESKKKNKGFGYNYMSLHDLLKLIFELGKKHQINFLQKSDLIDGKEVIVTKIIDTKHNKDVMISRKKVCEDLSSSKNGAQANGSAVTYARRYDLITLFRILPEEDKDGVFEKKPEKKKYEKKKYVTKYKKEDTQEIPEQPDFPPYLNN